MMTNLFSVFDPSASFPGSSNWVVLISVGLVLPIYKWSGSARSGKSLSVLTYSVSSEVKVLLPSKSLNSVYLLMTVFWFIVLSNLLGLLPYVFTSTAHLTISLSLSLPLWLGYYFKGWIKHSGSMLAHLVPLGTPSSLMPFMVIIESVSGLIRPLTLAVRLAANMVAGHLLLTLMSNAVSIFNPVSGGGIILSQVMLITLEVAVAAIQAYVFTILTTLYMSEV